MPSLPGGDVPDLSPHSRALGEPAAHAGARHGGRLPVRHVRGRRRLPADALLDVLRHPGADRGRHRRQSDRRHLRVGRARALAPRQYRFPHGRGADRRRRGRRADRRVRAQAAARGGPGRPDHLAHLCRAARRDRQPDARRERPRHPPRARRQAGLGAQARTAQLDPRHAAQAALSPLAALYQRHSRRS